MSLNPTSSLSVPSSNSAAFHLSGGEKYSSTLGAKMRPVAGTATKIYLRSMTNQSVRPVHSELAPNGNYENYMLLFSITDEDSSADEAEARFSDSSDEGEPWAQESIPGIATALIDSVLIHQFKALKLSEDVHSSAAVVFQAASNVPTVCGQTSKHGLQSLRRDPCNAPRPTTRSCASPKLNAQTSPKLDLQLLKPLNRPATPVVLRTLGSTKRGMANPESNRTLNALRLLTSFSDDLPAPCLPKARSEKKSRSLSDAGFDSTKPGEPKKLYPIFLRASVKRGRPSDELRRDKR